MLLYRNRYRHIFYIQIIVETVFCRKGRVARIQLEKAMGAQKNRKNSCGKLVLRYIHAILNTIMAFIGVIIIVNGVTLVIIFNIEAKGISIPICVIALGSVYVLISFLGCCVAIRESFYLTMSYVVSLLILFILLSAGMTYHEAFQNSIDKEQPQITDRTPIVLYGTGVLILFDLFILVITACTASSFLDDKGTKRNEYFHPLTHKHWSIEA